MNERKVTEVLKNCIQIKKNQHSTFQNKAKFVLHSLVRNKKRQQQISGLNQKVANEMKSNEVKKREEELLQQAKQEAQDLLTFTFHESEKMYQEVQREIVTVKEEILVEKKQVIDQLNEEKQKAEKITQLAENNADELITSANKKMNQIEEELSVKKVTYQIEIDRELEKLVKEKEWFEQYQKQVQDSIERKEKELFYKNRKKIEQEQAEKATLQNKIDYLKALNTKRKLKSYRIGLIIFGCTVVMSVLISMFRYSTPIIPFIIACLAFLLVYINLVDGKNEQEIKEIGFQNASLIEKNKMLTETIEDLEKDIKKLTEEKIEIERTKRQSQDNIEFLKIMQADLKESEIHRRILESENAALRKYLVSEEPGTQFNDFV